MTTPDPLEHIRASLSAAAATGGYLTIGDTSPRPARKKPALTRQIVKANNFDMLDWHKVRREHFDLREAIEDLFHGDLLNPEVRPGYYNAPELIQDIFMAFFRPFPTINKLADVAPDARLNAVFVLQMFALTDYQRLHDTTATDPLLAMMATIEVAEALKDMIRLNVEPVQVSNRQRVQAVDQQAGASASEGDPAEGDSGTDAQAQGEGAQEGADGPAEDGTAPSAGSSETQPQGGAAADTDDTDDPDGNLDGREREFDTDYADADYGGAETGFQELLDGLDLARHVDLAISDVADKIEELEIARKGIGLEDGEWKTMDPAARLALADRLTTNRMREIADLMGRMRREAANQQLQKVTDAPLEIYSVEVGNDLNRLLLSEYAFLGHPASAVEFYRRYAQAALLQFAQRGHEDVGKGPLIVLVDNSGTMAGPPENWAKAVAEALRRICMEQDRDYLAIYFGSNKQRMRFEFPKGRGPFEQVMEFLSVSAAWGTEFDGILTEGLAKAQNAFDGEAKGKADIVFITDGQAKLDQAWIDQFVAERNRIGTRIFGVFISAQDTVRTSALELLETFCTVVIPVNAFAVNDEAATTVFSQV